MNNNPSSKLISIMKASERNIEQQLRKRMDSEQKKIEQKILSKGLTKKASKSKHIHIQLIEEINNILHLNRSILNQEQINELKTMISWLQIGGSKVEQGVIDYIYITVNNILNNKPVQKPKSRSRSNQNLLNNFMNNNPSSKLISIMSKASERKIEQQLQKKIDSEQKRIKIEQHLQKILSQGSKKKATSKDIRIHLINEIKNIIDLHRRLSHRHLGHLHRMIDWIDRSRGTITQDTLRYIYTRINNILNDKPVSNSRRSRNLNKALEQKKMESKHVNIQLINEINNILHVHRSVLNQEQINQLKKMIGWLQTSRSKITQDTLDYIYKTVNNILNDKPVQKPKSKSRTSWNLFKKLKGVAGKGLDLVGKGLYYGGKAGLNLAGKGLYYGGKAGLNLAGKGLYYGGKAGLNLAGKGLYYGGKAIVDAHQRNWGG